VGNHPVSVLMPIRNGATFLPDAMENVSKFLRPIDELIIVDDGSTDKTPQILNELREQFRNFRLVNGSGMGLVSALNVGLEECSYDWVARMDVDDTSSADRLELQTNLISDRTVAIFSDYSFFSKDFTSEPRTNFPLSKTRSNAFVNSTFEDRVVGPKSTYGTE
jgi:glycosyltransferase involved in cell wall biosynthesis